MRSKVGKDRTLPAAPAFSFGQRPASRGAPAVLYGCCGASKASTRLPSSGQTAALAAAAAAAATVPPLQAAVQGCTRGMFTGLVLGILWGVWEEKKFVFRNCVKVRARVWSAAVLPAAWTAAALLVWWLAHIGLAYLLTTRYSGTGATLPLQPYHLRECPTRLFAIMRRSVTTAPVVATFMGACERGAL